MVQGWYLETERVEEGICRKRLIVNKDVAYKRKTNSIDAVELWYIGKYLCKIIYKWENKISKI
jgi:hypothetical protein